MRMMVAVVAVAVAAAVIQLEACNYATWHWNRAQMTITERE